MMKVIAIPMLATIAAVGAQTINIYSSTDCSGTPTTYDCGSVWDSCEVAPITIGSYEITDDGGQQCPPCGGNCVFNSFKLFSDDSCGSGTALNGGAGEAGCAPNGCLTPGADVSGESTTSLSLMCSGDFICSDEC